MPFDLHAAFQDVSSSLKNLQQMLVLIHDLLRSADFRPIFKSNENLKPLTSSSNCEDQRGQECQIHLFGLSLHCFSDLNLSLLSSSDHNFVSQESQQKPLDSVGLTVNLTENANSKGSVHICNCGKFKEDKSPPQNLHSSIHHFLGFSFFDLSTFCPSNGAVPMKNLINSVLSTDEKHTKSICKCKDLPVLNTSMNTEIVPASLSQSRLNRNPGCKRKRLYLYCNCSHIGDGPQKQWMPFTVDKLLLGFGLQEIIDTRKKAMISKVLGFARLQVEPGVLEATTVEEVHGSSPSECSNSEGNRSLKAAINRLNVKLPSIDLLKRSQLATILVEFMEHVPQIGKASQGYPDKQKLISVQDFFKYTEAEGKKLFEELDRDRDGQVTLEDLEIAMRKRQLPHYYARDFLQKTRNHWFKKSFGWAEFLSLMKQKEPIMLRAFNSLCVSKSGSLRMSQILMLLVSAGLPATEGNAAAMMRFFEADTEGVITYGQFRNFLLLLPSERLVDDPWMAWIEAATVVPMAPPVEMPAGNVLKSALAGGLACIFESTLFGINLERKDKQK